MYVSNTTQTMRKTYVGLVYEMNDMSERDGKRVTTDRS